MSLLSDLLNLNLSDTTNKVIAEYIWIEPYGTAIRSKARTLPGPVSDPSKLPKWNYVGSRTGQAPGEDVILIPRAIFKDPFRRGRNILVICDTFTPEGVPISTNNAAKILWHPGFFLEIVAEAPWYGIEQEYTLLQKDVKWPLGWPVGGFPGRQGPYYCGIDADKAWGPELVDAHFKACLYAGINIRGINGGEVMTGQWEFQVGPSVGISAGDEVWAARYILERIAENAGVVVTLHPKPILGVANRGASIRVGGETEQEGKGYFFKLVEDLMFKTLEHVILKTVEHVIGKLLLNM